MKDAENALRLVHQISPDVPFYKEYFEQNSFMFLDPLLNTNLDETSVMNACLPILDILHPGQSHTFTLQKPTHTPALNSWSTMRGNNDYYVLLSTSSPCSLSFIPHSQAFASQWLQFASLNNNLSILDNFSNITLNLENLEAGRPILFSFSIAFCLKEGQFNFYRLTRNNTKKALIMSKPKTLDECNAKHAELQARLARVDPRALDLSANNMAKVKEHSSSLTANSDKKDINKYAGCLATLEDRIARAENDTKLPGILKTLEEISRVLKEDMENVAKKDRNQASKEYQKLAGMEHNLVGKEQQINDLLARCKGLADGTVAPSSVVPSSAKEGAKEVVVVVPQIQEDALSPFICDQPTGPMGYQNIVASWKTQWKPLFATMTQALQNEQVTALYQKWLAEEGKVSQQVRIARNDTTSTVDITLYAAYGEALKKIYEDTKHKPSTTTTTTNPTDVTLNGVNSSIKHGSGGKTIKCPDCDKSRKEFSGSGLCKDCFSAEHVEPFIESLEQRADLLSRQATREQDEEGPVHKLYEEYCVINEALVVAYENFTVPNATVAVYERLKEVMQRADAMLPKRSGEGADDDDEEEYDDRDDIDNMIAHSDEEEEEEQERISSKKKDRKNNKRGALESLDDDEDDGDDDEEPKDHGLAHEAMLEMARLPVDSFRAEILKAYLRPERHNWIREELKDAKTIKEVYGFSVQEQWKDEKGETHKGEPEEWHTFFIKESEAVHLMNETRIPDKIITKKIVKRVERDDEEHKGEEEEEHKKKSKKNEENE